MPADGGCRSIRRRTRISTFDVDDGRRCYHDDQRAFVCVLAGASAAPRPGGILGRPPFQDRLGCVNHLGNFNSATPSSGGTVGALDNRFTHDILKLIDSGALEGSFADFVRLSGKSLELRTQQYHE